METLGYQILNNTPGVKTITVPGTVKTWQACGGYWGGFYVHEGVFSGSSLESVTVANGLEAIGDGAFLGVETLKSITLPNTLKDIYSYAFMGCTGLLDVYYHGTQEQWVLTNMNDQNDPLLDAGIHFIPDDEEIEPTPDFILPSALTKVEAEAFANNAFTYVKLGENVKSIGSRAFADCKNLRHIYIPEGTYPIAIDAFSGVPAGLTIHGQAESYAELYAGKYGYKFVAD